MRVLRVFFLTAAFAAFVLLLPSVGRAAGRPSLATPALSPDGSVIAFVSGGHIWTVGARGGEARILIDDGATDDRPMFSPDGSKIAFISTKTGNGDIYIYTLRTGVLTRLTYDDGYDELSGWSRDGWIYFSNGSHNIQDDADIYRVRASGGTPMAIERESYVGEYFGAPSPDDRQLAFNARGWALSQWWRVGHSHLDDSNIWIRSGMGAHPTYRRLTSGSYKNAWAMWGDDGRIYYVSDRSGSQNLWEGQAGQDARQLTHFSSGRVVWPSISPHARAIVFERDFGIWRFDTSTGDVARLPITLRGVISQPEVTHVALSRGFSDYRVSPDGKKIVYVVRGRLFAAAASGGASFEVPLRGKYAREVTWAPDSTNLAFAAGNGHEDCIYLYDFQTGTTTQLTSDPADIRYLTFDPKGKRGTERLAYERSGSQLQVLDIADRRIRTVARGYLPLTPGEPDRGLAWSPDGTRIAYFAGDAHNFSNVWVVSVADAHPHAMSFLANNDTNTLSWSPDGTSILFDTGQRTELAQVARVSLTPETPTFAEDRFHQLFKPNGAPAAGVSTAIDFHDIADRLRFLPIGYDVYAQSVSPDGKTLLVSATSAGQMNLYLFPLTPDAVGVARQITASPGSKVFPQWSHDGKTVYYLSGDGTVHAVSLDHDDKDAQVALTAAFDDDWNLDKVEAFVQAWSAIRDFYADPHTNGVNWNAVRSKYLPQFAGAQTPDEMRRLLTMMIGELNSSHMGVYAPYVGNTRTTGHLGLDFDRIAYENHGALEVSRVIAQSPAAVSGKIAVGDVITAVDGVPIGARVNLDELLDNQVGKKLIVSVRHGTSTRDVALKPVGYADASNLRYLQWVADNAAYVDRISGGRIGYVHMIDMEEGSLQKLYRDLDTRMFDKDAVVVDLRSNYGGFVNAYALDVLSREHYLNLQPRNGPVSQAREISGQRALEKPTVLVVNAETLSDGEDFTQGYEAMHLGKVVGEPTAGWIIYTSAITLIDGTVFRLPFARVTTAAGEPMEMHPRPVDVRVQRPIGSDARPQLDAAVKILLEGIPQTNGKVPR